MVFHSLLTEIEGDPAQIESAATYLRTSTARGARSLADRAAAQRSRLREGWQGEAGEAFGDRARILIRAADDVGESAVRAATGLEALAAALRTTQTGLHQLRGEAAEAGLVVTATTIESAEASPIGGVGSPTVFGELGYTYRALAARHEQIMRTWETALDEAARSVSEDQDTLGFVTANLISAAYTTYLVGLNSHILKGQAAWFTDEARRLRWLADEHVRLARQGRLRLDYGHYDDLMDRMRQAEAEAKVAEAGSKEIPPFVRRFSTSVNVVGAGYGVYADIQDGESTTQAVASQTVGLVGAITTGSVVGTAVPIPVVGTALGALAGLGIGLTADWAVDRVFEGPPERTRSTGASGNRSLGEREAEVSVLLGGNPAYEPPSCGPVPK